MSQIATQENTKIFNELYSVDVGDKVENKDTGKAVLKYLSWAWAWAEVKKRCPDAHYTIIKNDNNLPYFYDPNCGIMVYTNVTINGETHEMWLPVMDSRNNAMKFEPYEIKGKYGTTVVPAATMFDVNKAVMRCLTKNLSMFGLGLYIYAGEDLPEESEDVKKAREEEQKKLAEAIATTISNITSKVKTLTENMDKDAKIAFADKYIVPVIGQKNFKACNDITKLRSLYEVLSEIQ